MFLSPVVFSFVCTHTPLALAFVSRTSGLRYQFSSLHTQSSLISNHRHRHHQVQYSRQGKQEKNRKEKRREEKREREKKNLSSVECPQICEKGKERKKKRVAGLQLRLAVNDNNTQGIVSRAKQSSWAQLSLFLFFSDALAVVC